MTAGVAPPEIEQQYLALEEKVRALRPDAALGGLRLAYEYAATQHAPQKRASGDPYIIHPIGVAGILADMEMDLVCLQTGLRHDVVEDTGATVKEIREKFGDEVARDILCCRLVLCQICGCRHESLCPGDWEQHRENTELFARPAQACRARCDSVARSTNSFWQF